MGFNDYFSKIISKANMSSNKEEVKVIRNKLIKYGLVALVVGGLGSFICFISFALCGFGMVGSVNPGDMNVSGGFDFSFGSILIPFFLLIPCGIIAALGAISIKAGLAIAVTQVGTKFLDENKYCPNCGDIVSCDEDYCDKCGSPLLVDKICNDCNTSNALDAKFCKKCGKQL